jgi:hypothetical protein
MNLDSQLILDYLGKFFALTALAGLVVGCAMVWATLISGIVLGIITIKEYFQAKN